MARKKSMKLEPGMEKVRTIGNGNCLFAAFAMAYRNKKVPMTRQDQLAATTRQLAVRVMSKKKFWNDQGRGDTIPLEIEDEHQKAEMLDLVKSGKITEDDLIDAYLGNKKKYVEIMGISQVYGGDYELAALAYGGKRNIIVYDEQTGNKLTIYASPPNGPPVYLYRNGLHYEAITKK